MDQQIAGSSRKMMARVSQSVFLPQEMVLEILSWLEVKSLLRCKCVCRQWYALMQLKEFAEMRWNRGSRFSVIKREGERLNFDGSNETFRIVSYCDGLLLEKRLSSNIPSAKYRMSNPSTKQILDLPDPHETIVNMSIYLHPSTGSYNVVSLYFEKESRKLSFEVIDVGCGPSEEDLSWRTLKISDFYNLTREETKSFYVKIPVISTKGIAYLCRICKAGSSDAEIICIDINKEVSTAYKAPRNFFSDWENVKFMLWNDMPSVLGFVGENLVVWVLEDHKNQKWSDIKMAISSMCLESFPAWKKVLTCFSCKDGEDVITFTDGVKRFAYRVESKIWCQIPIEMTFVAQEALLTP